MRLSVHLFLALIVSLATFIGCVSVDYLPDDEDTKLSDEIRFLASSEPGFYYTVVQGDTLWNIAQRYKVNLEILEAANQKVLKGSRLLRAGMRLFIPGREILETSIPQETEFIWPLRGTLLGPGSINGINIKASAGEAIYAVKSGRVAFASERIQGYGQGVIINHSDGFISFYGHLSEILVKYGDQVKQGQVIGRAGMTGRPTEPQLHFRLLKDNKLVNPLNYLPK